MANFLQYPMRLDEKEDALKKDRYKKETGFTLIELMIVLTIVGILAAMAIPRFMRTSTKTKQKEAQLLLKQIYTMERAYRQEYDTYYPGNGGTVVVNPGGIITRLDVEIMLSALYSYAVTSDRTSFTATAGSMGASGLDDDVTLDIWTIDQTGILTCVSDDALN
jgi:prepilin-type N-terminal cleavage/methylation domain-containing protein